MSESPKFPAATIPFRPGDNNDAQAPPEELPFADMLMKVMVSSEELQNTPIPPRRDYLGGWLCEGDYGIIFAPRGVGKTWFAMGLSHALAANESFGPWVAGEDRCRVLYVDGEMPLALTQARDRGLTEHGDLYYLHHDMIFEEYGKSLNLARPEAREAIRDLCQGQGVNVVILDNLSTLVSGLQENDSKDWEGLSNWFLEMRRLKLTVILIHHAGRNGQMRGTSKREDMAAWILRLTSDDDAADDGARFVSHFDKRPRVMADHLEDHEWHFVTEQDGTVTIDWQKAQTADRFRSLIEAGITRNAEISQELGVSPGMVSRLAKKATEAGWLTTTKGRDYALKEDLS